MATVSVRRLRGPRREAHARAALARLARSGLYAVPESNGLAVGSWPGVDGRISVHDDLSIPG